MAEVKIDLTEYDLDEITIDCPFRKPGQYHYGSHDHVDVMPADFPCSGYDRGPSIIRLLRYVAEKVGELDRQVNPPPPKLEPKPKRTQTKKEKK